MCPGFFMKQLSVFFSVYLSPALVFSLLPYHTPFLFLLTTSIEFKCPQGLWITVSDPQTYYWILLITKPSRFRALPLYTLFILALRTRTVCRTWSIKEGVLDILRIRTSINSPFFLPRENFEQICSGKYGTRHAVAYLFMVQAQTLA